MMRVAAARSSVLLHELVRATARMVMPEPTSTYGVLTRRLARGSAAALAIYVLGAGVSYCAQILVARIIGADGYGVYAYVIAWMTILAYFSALGFDVSLLRFIPAYRAQQAPDFMQGVIRYAQRSVTAVGVGVALIGGATMMLARHHLSPALANTFLMGFAVVPIWALLWVRGSLVRAFGGVVSALVPDRIARDGLLLCVLLLAVRGLGWHPDAFSTIGVTVICSGMALYSVSFAANKLRSRELAGIRPTYERSRWLQSAAPLVMIATIEPLMNRTGVVLLGWVGDVKAAGIYAVAFNVSFLVMLPCTAVNVLFAPTAADLFARSDRAGLQSLVVRTAAWTLLSAISIALPLTILADPVLGLFGHDFTAGAGALRILLVGQVIAAGAGSLRPLMLMTGHERAAALLLALCAATGGLLGAVLIGPLGLAGAAVATALTLIFWNLAMGLFVWRHLRLLPGVSALFHSLYVLSRNRLRRPRARTQARRPADGA
jgi:O-antigen/teichoic acid export membrane protein